MNSELLQPKLRHQINWLALAAFLLLHAGCNQSTPATQRHADQTPDAPSANINRETTGSDVGTEDSASLGISSPHYTDPGFDLDDSEFYTPLVPKRDAGGLMLAGSNLSADILKCETINGLEIQDIELLMRPNHLDERSSTEGFLTADQKLIDVLVADNDYVTSCGLSHRGLAIPLLQISNRAISVRNETRNYKDPVDFKHAGTMWRVKLIEYKGFQLSPFNDDTKTNFDFEITTLDNGQSLKYSGLVPLMIERYGFYEGPGTAYRVEPSQIIETLGYKPEK